MKLMATDNNTNCGTVVGLMDGPTYSHDPDADVKLICGDCLEILASIPAECVNLIFADPPYFLSNNGITCHAGRMVPVNKGHWDKSRGVTARSFGKTGSRDAGHRGRHRRPQ